MGSHFPELRLCDLNWKAEQIATNHYPSYFNNWSSKYGSCTNQKDEDCLVVTKRSQRESTMAVPKQQKVDLIVSGNTCGLVSFAFHDPIHIFLIFFSSLMLS